MPINAKKGIVSVNSYLPEFENTARQKRELSAEILNLTRKGLSDKKGGLSNLAPAKKSTLKRWRKRPPSGWGVGVNSKGARRGVGHLGLWKKKRGRR